LSSMEDLVPLAYAAFADLLIESKADVRRQVAADVLESEGHLKRKSLVSNRQFVLNLKSDDVRGVLTTLKHVFAGAVEQNLDAPAVVETEVLEEPVSGPLAQTNVSESEPSDKVLLKLLQAQDRIDGSSGRAEPEGRGE